MEPGAMLMAIDRLRIGPADHGRRMTLEEFREADEVFGYRYELARGALEVAEIPEDSHGQVIHNLHELFSLYRVRYPELIRRIAHAANIRVVAPEDIDDQD